MKTTLLTLLGVLLFFPTGLNSQNTKKVKTHKAWITLTDNSELKGILYSADEDLIKITYNNSLDVTNLMSIEANKIEIIKIRKKGKVGKGALIGGLSGLGFGVLIGFAAGDDDPGWFSTTKEEKAIGGGIAFGLLGTGVGALTGTSKKKIIINGNIKNYKSQLTTIQGYSLALD